MTDRRTEHLFSRWPRRFQAVNGFALNCDLSVDDHYAAVGETDESRQLPSESSQSYVND